MVEKPTVLAFEECAIPDQDWTPYSEAVFALIVGGSGRDFEMNDPRLTEDAIELAEATLSTAAYEGAVHFYGYLGERDEIHWRNPERINSSLFDRTRKKIIHLSGDDQIQIGNSIWSGVYIDARSLHSWIETQVSKRANQLLTRGRRGKRIKGHDRKTLYARMQIAYEELMKGLPPNPKRTQKQDKAYFTERFEYVPRKMVEDVRKWWKERHRKARIQPPKPIKISSGV